MTLEQKLPPRRTESQFENDLRLSIQDIPKSKGENLVQFLPLVLDRLLYLMVRPPILGGQQGKKFVDTCILYIFVSPISTQSCNIKLDIIEDIQSRCLSVLYHCML